MRFRFVLPLSYFISSRANNWRGLLGFIAVEYLPLGLTLWLIHGKNFVLTGITFVGFLCFYEIAYLANDLASSAKEPGGTRQNGSVAPFWIFGLNRLAYGGGVAIWIRHEAGSKAAIIYIAANLAILMMGLLHTRAGLSKTRWPRILTFGFLAIYKYAPWTLPFVQLPIGGMLLLGTFLYYGLSRVVEYSQRKLYPQNERTKALGTQRMVQAMLLVLMLPNIFLFKSPDLASLWLIHCLFLVVLGGAAHLRGGHKGDGENESEKSRVIAAS